MILQDGIVPHPDGTATSESHHLFGTIKSITVNSISIVLYVVRTTLCLSYYSGFKRSKDE